MKVLNRNLILASTLFVFANATSPPAIAHETAIQSYGDVSFPISCDSQTQPKFNHGVAQLHNMMYIQAEGIFNQAAEHDPDCAMLYWGVAMSNFHPLWPGMQNKAEFERGTAAIQKALTLPVSTDKELDFINAANSFYAVPFSAKRGDRINAWAKQQYSMFKTYPDDIEATALYALSHLATAPKSDKTLAHQRTAGKLMEELRAKEPTHPAGFHYLIHAYDNPEFASKAEEVSRAYDSIAPEVPHALHMPSHIFVRMGLWNETVFWNSRSADAAVEQSNESMTSMHYAHAMDYLVYAQLQQGKIDDAAKSLQQLYDIDNHQDGFAAAYALTASPARVPLEQDNWPAAASLPVNAAVNISWDKFKFAEPITHFARGIGAARSDDIDLAKTSIAELERLHTALKESDQNYWATLTDSKIHSVKAWVAFAEKDFDTAINLMAKGADIEDSVDKSPVTPGAVLPARELYGDMLQLLDKPADALLAYEKTLGISPGRARSLRGAVEAAEGTGNKDKANEYKAYLKNMVAAK